jgi:capsular polysaccharide export protein
MNFGILNPFVRWGIKAYKASPTLRNRKILYKFYKNYLCRQHAAFDYESDFWEYYNAESPVAFLWGFDKKRSYYWQDFFSDEQTLAFYSLRRIKKAIKEINCKNTTIYIKGDKRRRNIERIAKNYGVSIKYLKRGPIGHPTNGSYPACFKIKGNDNDLSEELIKSAKNLRPLFCKLGINYHGSPSFIDTEKYLGIDLGKRILVLSGKPKGRFWRFQKAQTRRDLIKIAISENPEDTVYVYSSGKKKHYAPVKRHIRIKNRIHTYFFIHRPIRPIDLIQACDKIYTNNSPSAIDAIIYQKKLIVTGKPSYAGIGLTEDRQIIRKKNRKSLSVDEFFARIYLDKVRYPYGEGDNTKGLLSVILEISGNYKLRIIQQHSSLKTKNDLSALLSKGRYPKAIYKYLDKKNVIGILKGNRLNFSEENRGNGLSSFVVSAAFIGKSLGLNNLPDITRNIKDSIPYREYSRLMQRIIFISPKSDTLFHLSGTLGEKNEWNKGREIVEYISKRNNSKHTYASEYTSINYEKYIATSYQNERDYNKAEDCFIKLLMQGTCVGVINNLADIYASKFMYEEAADILYFSLYSNQKERVKTLKKITLILGKIGDTDRLIPIICAAIIRKQTFFIQGSTYTGLLNDREGELPWAQAFKNMSFCRLKTERKNENQLFQQSNIHMMCEEFRQQRRILSYIKSKNMRKKLYMSLMMSYVLSGKKEKSISLTRKVLEKWPEPEVFRQAIKICIRAKETGFADEIFDKAKKMGIEGDNLPISEMLYRKQCFIKGNIHEAFKSCRKTKGARFLKYHLGTKYNISAIASGKSARSLLLSSSGPGDELRFASLYKEMHLRFGGDKVTITCSPRLLALLQRSFEGIRFLPVEHVRGINYTTDISKYNELPSEELHAYLDNAGWEEVQSSESVNSVMDMIPEVIKTKNDIKGDAYIKADPDLIAKWDARCGPQRRIGISWRSSLATYTRNEHYLSIEMLKPVLDEFSGRADFYNLQYDNPVDDLSWAKENCLAPIINFDDLDQFNDLDSVAALMKCMDIIIAPATTVVELAGALGCPTILLSNSSELHWREIDEQKTDVWHRSVRHVRGDSVGDKETLVANLMKEINTLLQYN